MGKLCLFGDGKRDKSTCISTYHMRLVVRKPAFCICENKDADRGRTGLMVRASDSGSGDPGSILGRVGVFVSLSKRHLLPKSTGNTQEYVAPSQHD